MEIKIKVVQSPPESDMTGHQIIVAESGASIGRAATNTLALPDPNRYVSSLHAKIQFNGECFEIVDQSTNGTFLNNLSQALVKGQPRLIAHRDQILMGPFVLEVEVVGADISDTGGDSTSVTSELEDTTSLTIPPNDAEVDIDDLDKWLEPDTRKPEPLPKLKPATSAEEDSLISPLNKELDPLSALGKGSEKDDSLGLNFGIGEGDWNAAEGELPNAGELGGQRMDIPGMIPTDWDKSLVAPAGEKPSPRRSPPLNSDPLPDPAAVDPLQNKPAGISKSNSLLDLVNTPSEQLKPAASAEKNSQLGDDDFFANTSSDPVGPSETGEFAIDDVQLTSRNHHSLDETGLGLESSEDMDSSKPLSSDQPIASGKSKLALDPTDSQVDKHLSDWLDIAEPEPIPKMQDERPDVSDAAMQYQDPAEAEGKIVTNKSGDDLLKSLGSDLESESLNDLLGSKPEQGRPERARSDKVQPEQARPEQARPDKGKPGYGQPKAGSPMAKRRTTGRFKVPPAVPGADSLIDFFNEQPGDHPGRGLTDKPPGPESQSARPVTPAEHPQTEKKSVRPAAIAGDVRLARELAEGMGLTGLSEQQLGELIPVVAKFVVMTVDGLMSALRARQTIKNEFRMNLTMIQAVENNPLKFSLSAEDAIENLFVKKRKAYLSATEAAGEAFADIADHQLALFNGIREAYDELMEQFSPERLEKRFERQRGKSLFGGSGKKWEAYQDFIAELNEDQERTFKHLFGEIFAEQYEKSFENLKAKRRE